jgi:hypothetical protein
MAEKVNIELEIKDNVKSLKAQLREAQNEVTQLSEKFGATSKEAVQAAKRAAELKDAIADAKDLTDAFNPDAKFNALSNSIGGVLNGFQAFEGALGLVGVEGEAVQETLLKVQSAMAVSQGIQGLMEAKDSFKQLGAVAVDALKGIRTGVAATGIGLLLVAVGTLVAYWDDIKEAMSGVSEEQEKLNEQAQKSYEISKKALDNINAQDNILKLQGKSEKEILQLKIRKTQETINEGIEALRLQKLKQEAEEKAAVENFDRAKVLAKFFVDTALILPKLMLVPIDLAIKGANKVSEALGMGKLIAIDLSGAFDQMTTKAGEFLAGTLFNVEEVREEGKKTREEIQKQIVDLQNTRAGYQLEIKNIDKEAADKRAQAAKEAADKEKEAEAQRQKELLESLKEKNLTEEEIEQMRYDELGRIAAEAEQKKRDQMMEDALLEGQLRTAIFEKELADIEEAERLKKEMRERNKQFAIDSSISTLQTIADLTNAFAGKDEAQQKKAFQVQKAANIAKATVETYKAAQGAYASQLIPGDPTSPIRATIAAAIAVAAGIANVKKIASTQFDAGGTSASAGGSMGSGATGGGAITTPANFNIVGNAGANPLAGLNQPIQAYVVSGQITSAQELDRKQISYSSFP